MPLPLSVGGALCTELLLVDLAKLIVFLMEDLVWGEESNLAVVSFLC